MRTTVAGLVFALLYGAGMRLYFYLRAGGDSHRWHLPVVAVAGLLGGLGFYLAQQIRSPHPPGLLDIPAFVIMAVAAASVAAILETFYVLRARLPPHHRRAHASGSAGTHGRQSSRRLPAAPSGPSGDEADN